MIQLSPGKLNVLISNLESQVQKDGVLQEKNRYKKLHTLENSLKDSSLDIAFKTRLLLKKELDSQISTVSFPISKPVDMQKVKGHLWEPITYEVDKLTGGYFYTFKVKDECYKEFQKNSGKYREVNTSIFPAIERHPQEFRYFNPTSCENDIECFIKKLAAKKALNIGFYLDDMEFEEKLLLMKGCIGERCNHITEKIKEKYPFLDESIQAWLDHWKNPQSFQEFSFLGLMNKAFEAKFLDEYEKQKQSNEEMNFFEPMRTWLFRNLGYRFYKNCDTNEIESVRFPDFQSLSKRWKLCENYMPHLPNLVFTDAEGISSDELYVRKVTLEGDILLSNDEEFFHDQSAHIIPLINSIGFSGIKCDKTYKKGKEILMSLYSNIFLKVERAKSVQLLSGDILELNSEQKNYMRALASALVDGATSLSLYERKNNFSSTERSFLSLKNIIHDQNWQRYFKKRFDSNLVDSPNLFLEIFYQLLFGSKSEG